MSFFFPGSEVGASPQSGRKTVAAEGALLPPTPPSPRNLIPHGHRKCHSLGYKSAFCLTFSGLSSCSSLKILTFFFFLKWCIIFQYKSFACKKQQDLCTVLHSQSNLWPGSKLRTIMLVSQPKRINQNRKAEVVMIRLVSELTRMAVSEWQNYHCLVTQCHCNYFKFKIISLLYWYFYRETSFIDFFCTLTLFSNGFRLFPYKCTSNNILIIISSFPLSCLQNARL